MIAGAYGDDSDNWFGQPVILYSIMTEYQGKSIAGIRIRIPPARDNPKDPITTGPQPDPDLNDSLPFDL